MTPYFFTFYKQTLWKNEQKERKKMGCCHSHPSLYSRHCFHCRAWKPVPFFSCYVGIGKTVWKSSSNDSSEPHAALSCESNELEHKKSKKKGLLIFWRFFIAGWTKSGCAIVGDEQEVPMLIKPFWKSGLIFLFSFLGWKVVSQAWKVLTWQAYGPW
jgi:hypothetical protein